LATVEVHLAAARVGVMRRVWCPAAGHGALSTSVA
jgi:hypothetical protein